MASRLIFGAGYLGRRVADHWRTTGDRVTVVTRSERSATAFRRDGFEAVVANVADDGSVSAALENNKTFDTVLYAVGYDRTSGEDREAVSVHGPRDAATALSGRFGKWLFTSSTSVYGQTDGEWVDEDSTTEPPTENGQRCVRAEKAIRDATKDHDLLVLRLAGLYGPGRQLAKADSLRDQLPMPGSGQQWLNLVHVDDAAAACVAAADNDVTGLVLVSDDEPVRRADYYGMLASLTDCRPPVFDEQPRTSRGASNKRCRNDRLKQALVPSLHFPTYREGLRSIIDH